MYISTREMLGQITSSRASAEAIIEKAYGPNYDWSKISKDLAISETVQKLGLGAFSDDALQHIVSALSRRQLQSANSAGDDFENREPAAA
jgi:hypothetical protein